MHHKQINTSNRGERVYIMPKVNINNKITVQTIIIAVLITGIIAFIGGIKYQESVYKHADSKTASAVAELSKSE